MPIGSIEQLKSLFANQGVTSLYVKTLAKNQDNEKNQIYLGKGLDGVLNLFPATIVERSASESITKRHSESGRAKLEAVLNFHWFDENGELYAAPNARIIDYFQYPEVRLSGFLKGSASAPRALRRAYQDEYQKRILVVGSAPDGRVLGRLLTAPEDPIASTFPDLPLASASGVLRVLPLEGSTGATPLSLITAELGTIVRGGWHPSQILKPGHAAPIPFIGAQGAGYTLEALLGVGANAAKEPDRHGFEVKSFGGDRISLMTPVPDGGYQGAHTFREFMGAYGAPGKDGKSRRFTGLHRCGAVNEKTQLSLRVAGYDAGTDSFGNSDAIAVELYSTATGSLAASWSLGRLANGWNRKHASAVYVRYEKRPSQLADHDSDYRYLKDVLIGQGTDVWRLLRAIHSGVVFYDPADTIYDDGKAKVRSQWRVSVANLPAAMKMLYATASSIDVQEISVLPRTSS